MTMMKSESTEDSAGSHERHIPYQVTIAVDGTEVLLTQLAWRAQVVRLMDMKEGWAGGGGGGGLLIFPRFFLYFVLLKTPV